jgi:LPXTG-site transpeptidase (sortase) family protein
MAVPFFIRQKGEMHNRRIINELELSMDQAVQSAKTEQAETEVSKHKLQTSLRNNVPEGIIGYLTIDKIDLKYAIVEGASNTELSNYIGHLPETAQLGGNGNCVLAGHRGGKNALFFKFLNKLEVGDSVEITKRAGKTYEYEIEDIYVTDAYDNAIKAQDKDKNILTLLTCENRGTRRLIVVCHKK